MCIPRNDNVSQLFYEKILNFLTYSETFLAILVLYGAKAAASEPRQGRVVVQQRLHTAKYDPQRRRGPG